MTTAPCHVAVDLGAGSGRTLVGGLADGRLAWREAHRFQYAPVTRDGHLRWDIEALVDGVREGLRLAASAARASGQQVASVGVDSWGVDYALLDRDGALVEAPICYRDARTAGAMDEVFARVSRDEIYSRTGIQFQPLNTLYQLWAHVRDGFPGRAERLLLMPDYCHHVLCGSFVGERTNASTTQLLSASTGAWDESLFARLGLPLHVMPPIVDAGTSLGRLTPEIAEASGLGRVSVVAPGTHDTASAVAATPLEPGWAYISSGTWSLVGVERDAPLVSSAAERAGLTNEAGVCGTTRLLTNVMGLWLLESCRREWAAAGRTWVLQDLLREVECLDGAPGVVYPDDPRFFAPASMVDALRSALTGSGQSAVTDPVRLAAVILDSLALRYAAVIAAIEQVTGQSIPGIHVVGGGAQNHYLNQATADAAGRPVLAGPVEATAAGNLIVQMMAAGTVPSLAAGRRLLAEAAALTRFEPRAPGRFGDAARRLAGSAPSSA